MCDCDIIVTTITNELMLWELVATEGAPPGVQDEDISVGLR